MKTNHNILGVNVGHNASAALLCGEEITIAVQEERFTGRKNYTGYPKKSIDYILSRMSKAQIQNLKVVFATINQVAYWYEYPVQNFFTQSDYLYHYGEGYYSRKLRGHDVTDYYEKIEQMWSKHKFDTYLPFETISTREDKLTNTKAFSSLLKDFAIKQTGVRADNVYFIDHHTCHASYAYYAATKKNDDCAVITLDSDGDKTNQTIWTFHENEVEEIGRTNTCDLARVYKLTTLLLGMKPDEHEYKVMGLAPYAKDEYTQKAYEAVFSDLLIVENGIVKHKNRPKDMFNYLEKAFKPFRFDNIAGAVQMFIEETTSQVFKQVHQITGKRHFCLSGGVAMNVKLNMVLAQLPFVDQLYVPPSGSDESLSIGACYAFFSQNKLQSKPLNHALLGIDITPEVSLKSLKEAFNEKDYELRTNVSSFQVAQLLAQGEVIACVRGCAEFGARALGNRSILANPSNQDVVLAINEQIKNRDFWMPFALSILEEEHQEYLHNDKNISANFMTIAFNTRALNYSQIKAGTHPYDRTCRVQLVNKEFQPEYYKLIYSFKDITGIPALLNTSLNLHGNPMCSTLDQVVMTMQHSQLKYAYINDDFLIVKRS